MHQFSIHTLCNSHLLLTAPPLVHLLTSFSCFSSHRARGECQDGHLPLCSPLQHTNSHHHIPAAGGRSIKKTWRHLSTQVPALVAALSRQVRDKSPNTQLGCFTLLTSLVTVLRGAFDDHMGVVLTTVLFDVS